MSCKFHWKADYKVIVSDNTFSLKLSVTAEMYLTLLQSIFEMWKSDHACLAIKRGTPGSVPGYIFCLFVNVRNAKTWPLCLRQEISPEPVFFFFFLFFFFFFFFFFCFF